MTIPSKQIIILISALALTIGILQANSNSNFISGEEEEKEIMLFVGIEEVFNPAISDLHTGNSITIVNRSKVLKIFKISTIADCQQITRSESSLGQQLENIKIKESLHSLCKNNKGYIVVLSGSAIKSGNQFFIKQRAIKAGMELFLDSDKVMLRGMIYKITY